MESEIPERPTAEQMNVVAESKWKPVDIFKRMAYIIVLFSFIGWIVCHFWPHPPGHLAGNKNSML